MNIRQRRLPSFLQEVEYLESTGEQWIDTEIKTKSTTYIDITFSQDTAKGFGTICGGYAGISNQRTYISVNGNKISVSNGVDNDVAYFNLGEKYNIKYLERNKVTINNVEYSLFEQTSTYTTGINYGLFTRFYSHNQDFIGKIWYKTQIYEGNTIVRGLVNAYFRTTAQAIDGNTGLLTTYPQGKPCVYDLVEGKVYVNQGTGEDFIVGADIIATDSITIPEGNVTRIEKDGVVLWKKYGTA